MLFQVNVVRAAEAAVAQREAEVASREAAVDEREAFLLKRDEYYQGKRGGGGSGGERGGREFTDAHAARERAARRGGGVAVGRPGSGRAARLGGSGRIGSGGSSGSERLTHRRGSFGSDLSNTDEHPAVAGPGALGTAAMARGGIMGQQMMASMAGLGGSRPGAGGASARGRAEGAPARRGTGFKAGGRGGVAVQRPMFGR